MSNPFHKLAASLREAFPDARVTTIAVGQPTREATGVVLTPPEVAKQLRCRASQVLTWIRSGQLKAANLSKGSRPRYRVTPDDLAAFLKSRQPEPPKARARRAISNKPKRF